MEKSFILFTFMCILPIQSLSAVQAVDFTEGDHKIEYIDDVSREEDINKQIDDILAKLNSLRERSYYTSQRVSSKYAKVSGYAGGQPSGGNRFATDLGFYWSDSGVNSICRSVCFL